MTSLAGKILLVDDNETNIQVLAQLLQPAGYELEYALTGTAAIEWCGDTLFDLVLLDIMMPEIDGYDVCQMLKANKETADIPIIFISAKNDAESIQHGFDVGAVDYVSKPFQSAELLSRVSVHIGLKRSKEKQAVLYEELNQKTTDLLESIESAKLLQRAVLPTELELFHAFSEHYVVNRPVSGIGGDFYWLHRFNEDKIALCVGDSTGHGIPGALMSMFGIAQLHAVAAELKTDSPSKILYELRNRIIVQLHQSEENVSNSIDMAMVVIDTKQQTIVYSTADLPFIILTSADISHLVGVTPRSRSIENKKRNDVLYYIDQQTSTAGYDDFETEYTDTVVPYNPGDSIVLFSDGFKDQFGGPQSQKFSKTRFIELINNVSILPMEMQGFLLEKDLDAWMNGADQTDDITVIGVEL